MTENDLNKYYYKVLLTEIVQNNSRYFNAIINVNIIKDLFTVSPAVYTLSNKTLQTSQIGEKEVEIDEDYIQKLQAVKSTGGYQRFFDKSKLKEIEEYIRNDNQDFNILPNTIILSIEAIDYDDSTSIKELIDSCSNQLVFMDGKDYLSEIEAKIGEAENPLIIIENTKVLLIPKQLVQDARMDYDYFDDSLKPILVIDGNHRLLGIKHYLEHNDKNEFVMPVSIMINSDVKDDAQIFTTINTNAKPVNPSYYYQIMGEFHKGVDLDEHIFLHYIVRLFNETEDSPLYRRIKMLGKNLDNTPVKQSISQAFLINQLHDWLFLKKRSIRFSQNEVVKAPVFNKLFDYSQKKENKHENLDLHITKFIIQYFTTCKKLFEEQNGNGSWNQSFDDEDKNNTYPLLKTLGIGALIELIPVIYINYMYNKDVGFSVEYDNVMQKQFKILEEMKFKDFEVLIKDIFTDNFNLKEMLKSEEFTEGSGQSYLKKLANKMYVHLLNNNEYFKDSSKAIQNFIEWYKNSN